LINPGSMPLIEQLHLKQNEATCVKIPNERLKMLITAVQYH